MEPIRGHRSGKKRLFDDMQSSGDLEKSYRFKILLPNGSTVGLTLRNPKLDMLFEEFMRLVKEEYDLTLRHCQTAGMRKRHVHWNSGRMSVQDENDQIIRNQMNFEKFEPNKCHILRLHDGSSDVARTFENMWDLTPDTDLLMELPEEYTFETALADLIDNSLQAVWSNDKNERRMISVDVSEDRISIFDTGPGMDGSDENSIAKWGKMGASLHRTSKWRAIGGKPPYLKPFFGMFGYGGPIASMHLGRSSLVSSKRKASKKVYTLHLEREALLGCSNSERTWRTSGGIRMPSKDEMSNSPHGSFTKVEIFKPKLKCDDEFRLQSKLKDIYFPYIQCDSSSGKTCAPVKFQVNGVDLAEVFSGEVAITNMHSCNGPDFVVQIRFSLKQGIGTSSPGSCQEAHARLKFVYFPVKEEKEGIDRIIENLDKEGCGVNETYENFSRVSIRRLGRLLPDARWGWLPLMDLRQKKGDKSQLLKRCCWRVKCFIDTDAGFTPTPSKTDLAHHNPFTLALRNFGCKALRDEKDICTEIFKAEELLTPLQLEKHYQDWLLQMHELYDQEVDAGEDEPTVILSPPNKKALRVSSEVLRVHQELKRSGAIWKSGQKIKVFKGACPGVHKQNLYATLECFIIEGFQGDSGGEARIICRPMDVPDDCGCLVSTNGESAVIDMRQSLSLPVSIIDSRKCILMQNTEWEWLLEKQRQKGPSKIDLLTAEQCQELGLDGALPDAVHAGQVPPKEVVAVIRPATFNNSSVSKNLDQKYIVKNSFEMVMEVKYRAGSGKAQNDQHIYSSRITSTSCKGFQGLYIFPLGCKFPDLFQKAGLFIFIFSLANSSCKICEKRIKVEAASEVGKWRLLSDSRSLRYRVRVGSCFPPLAFACYDVYENRIPFSLIPKVIVKLEASSGVLIHIDKFSPVLSADKLSVEVKNLQIESDELDKIQPSYKATLILCAQDNSNSVSVPCHVTPGSVKRVTTRPSKLSNNLLPDAVVGELVLEMFDAYGNHAMRGLEVQLNLDGFCMIDQMGLKRKVGDNGCINLNGLLKVTAGFGKTVSFAVLSENKVVFKQYFQTERRELRLASPIPECCIAGSQLGNIIFEIVDGDGAVDVTINDDEKGGRSHALTVKTESCSEDALRYTFKEGRCTIPVIPISQNEGSFNFIAAHSRFAELYVNFKVNVVIGPKVEPIKILSPYSNVKLSRVQDSPSFNQTGSLVTSMRSKEMKMVKYGLRIGELEKTLETQNHQKEDIVHVLSELQASVQPLLLNDPYSSLTREEIIRQIESRDQSAASVLCHYTSVFSYREPWRYFLQDVVGVVALIGTVCSNGLSRILAEYLGEDQMLALVCRSFKAACALERYLQNGDINYSLALHEKANKLGKTVVGRFLVICLEDISPYTGKFEGRDPQRKLVLQDPLLPTRKEPPGFMGFAVNMVNMDSGYVNIRTASGDGLRETLFYRLFGKLQVYRTREDMIKARAYINHGAVSLDGGILKENGIMSLGRGKPEICFPVSKQEVQTRRCPEREKKLKEIEDKKLELALTELLIANCSEDLEKIRKKYYKVQEKVRKHDKLIDSFGKQGLDSESSSSQISPGCFGSPQKGI